ncbi:hypothetical protein J6590_042369 [Homalodisca vitripennis]|nr:hypothetical protein J6590_042369 [Homalodisca vitripennis]
MWGSESQYQYRGFGQFNRGSDLRRPEPGMRHIYSKGPFRPAEYFYGAHLSYVRPWGSGGP